MVQTAKGQRPVYLNDPQQDKLLGIIMALAGEVSVLRERLDTVERVLETKGILSTSEIETYQPDEKTSKNREQWRTEYLSRILRILEEEIDTI
ncbi:hypothetical protein M595_1873 [Lyngbya aestuarii BL J]|uniref:Uncharacterized protein n=1 Tax=Lyngbya aestuarii BL J TaxID=1348334 RepID=U7QNZ9_9CYAN|nr:hypothetical protein [Lyngbya aestuarii]ERT08126.1 hypothetical protein M595_1873 [Lyngbya aestuarii BL J]